MVKQYIAVLVAIILVITGLKANTVTDSLQSQLSQVDDSTKVKILCDLCWEFRAISTDSAILFGEQALQLSKKIQQPKGEAQAYNDLGIIYIGLGEFQTALDYFSESMVIRKQLGDTAGMGSLYNKIGIVYQKQGNLKMALENQINALRIYEQLNHELWIGYCLNNIAIVHQNLENLDKSLEYHFRALEYRIKLGDRYGEGGSLGNIANVYVKMKDTTRALEYYEKSLEILREVKDDEAVSVQLSNMGNIYAARGENAKALNLLNESLALREKLNDKKAIASTLVKLGDVYTNLEQTNRASRVLYRALSLAREIQVMEEEMGAYLALAKMYAVLHQLDSAFQYHKYYIAAKDSVYENRLAQQIIDVQEKYDTEKKEQQIELLTKEKELTEISIKQRKTEIGLLIFLIISILGVTAFVLYRRRQMQKAELDAARIRHNEASLKAVLEGQEDERRRIARELHDGVGQTLSGLKLNFETVSENISGDQKQAKLRKMTEMLDHAVTEVRSISHQMMPKELEQFGLVPAVRSILQFSFGSTSIQHSFEEMGMEERLEKAVELGLFRILQELIANILKHAEASEVSIQLIRRPKQIMMMVEDNGVGFDFDNIESSGIGLMNIQSRVEAIKGFLNYESEIGKGTTVTIRIPLT